MITGLPLQNKLRTYRKKKRKNNVRAFFWSVGLGPPPPPPSTAKPDEKFLDPRVDIRYRGGIETILLLNTFYSAAKILWPCLHLLVCKHWNKNSRLAYSAVRCSFENCLISSCITQKIESLAAEHTFIFSIMRGFESHQCFRVFFFIFIVSNFHMCPLSIIGKQF